MAKPGVVVAIREHVPVGAYRKRLHGHERLPLSQFVHIEQDFFVRLGADLLAAADRVLFTRLKPDVIKEVTFSIRDFHIGFLHAAEHLVIKLFLKSIRRLHHRVGVSILSLEISADLRVRLLAQPKVVIHQLVPVDLRHMRDFLRCRR